MVTLSLALMVISPALPRLVVAVTICPPVSRTKVLRWSAIAPPLLLLLVTVPINPRLPRFSDPWVLLRVIWPPGPLVSAAERVRIPLNNPSSVKPEISMAPLALISISPDAPLLLVMV